MAKKSRPDRPRDMSQLAKRVVDISVGEVEEEEGPDPEAVKRGIARAKSLTPEERSEIARKAARARWDYYKEEEE
jgi:hypothetical protein